MTGRSTCRALGPLVLGLAAATCGMEGTSPPSATPAGEPRTFAMGFTDFPHARRLDAVTDAWAVIARDGDMAVMHFDDGVPWAEALAGAPYPSPYAEELTARARAIPSGHVRYLAVTPIAFARDGLAPRRGGAGTEPLEAPWDRRHFDDPEVVTAFANHCERMIGIFDPHYFAFAVEVNILARLAPADWPAFLVLAREVYGRVKARHPALPVFLTLQADVFHSDPARQRTAIEPLLPFTDVIAVSTYPFQERSDPRALRADHFTALAALAPSKRVAVAETAWPAEAVTAPYPVPIPATEEDQRLYVERLLDDAGRLRALFVTWFFTRDYDVLWDEEMHLVPDAPLLRLWKDTGLYTGDGRPRPALASWRRWLSRPRV